MLGVDIIMTIKEKNIALLSTIPEECQPQIYNYLSHNFCQESPFEKKSANDIFKELAESRACYERGEYEDFDDALDEIKKKYDL